MAKSTISNDPVREHDKFMLRLPEGMRERIKDSADANGRSMNAEIIARIEEAEIAGDALRKAVELLEEMNKRGRRDSKVLHWVIEQQEGLVAIIDEIVAVDGKLDESFMKALRLMVSTKGSKLNEFPVEDEE